MSDTKAQSEPTMEEILASIRRIISDDGPEVSAAPKAGAPETTETPAAAPVAAPAPLPETPKATPADVLELTQMVEEDGSVVDLAAAEPVSDEGPEMPAAAEVAAAPESELKAEPEPKLEPEPVAETAPMPPEPEPVPEPVPEAPRPSAQQEKPMAPDNTPDDPGLMSPSPAGTTTSAFATLAAAVDASRGFSVGSGTRTLEDLVREMLRPMLREWLDANLPALVGRIVEREVAKLAGRAEDDHWH